MTPPPILLHAASWLTRNARGYPGHWRLVRWLDQQKSALAKLPPTTVTLVDRVRMRPPLADENGRFVFINGYWPGERITRQFIDCIRPGDTVLDIGANIGYFTLVAAHLAGPSGHVHAFEASPVVLPILRENIRLNPHLNITLHPAAVSDHAGEIEFHTAAAGQLGYSSIRSSLAATQSVDRVPAITVDSLCDELPRVSFIKVDVEGAEQLVLTGARRLIQRDRPIIVSELDDAFLRELGSSAANLCATLRDHGYTLEEIITAGRRAPLTTPPVERCNLIATPPPPATKRAAPPAARAPLTVGSTAS